MKQMIQKMREEKDGFTIAELLIVVAIVAVLVAIAIPVFTAQLNEARYGTDQANARSIYGELRSAQISNTTVDVDVEEVPASGETEVVTVTSGTGEDQSTNVYQFSGLTTVEIVPPTDTDDASVTLGEWNGHEAITWPTTA